jgi:hypothetical protein
MTTSYIANGDVTLKGRNLRAGYKAVLKFIKQYDKDESYFSDIRKDWCRHRLGMWPMICFTIYSDGAKTDYMLLEMLDSYLKRAEIRGLEWEICAREYEETLDDFLLCSEDAEKMEYD